MASRIPGSTRTSGGFLEGQLLIAMPSIGDSRFERSVIFMCAHSDEGAMGLIINRASDEITFRQLLEQLNVIEDEEVAAGDPVERMPVHIGGPVETARGFVLHSADYFMENSTLDIGGGICLTATLDILRALADGRGPRDSLLALGYAGWAPGQLESEIQANGWLHCDADGHIVFNAEIERKYDHAMGKLGIDPWHLASEAGHA